AVRPGSAGRLQALPPAVIRRHRRTGKPDRPIPFHLPSVPPPSAHTAALRPSRRPQSPLPARPAWPATDSGPAATSARTPPAPRRAGFAPSTTRPAVPGKAPRCRVLVAAFFEVGRFAHQAQGLVGTAFGLGDPGVDGADLEFRLVGPVAEVVLAHGGLQRLQALDILPSRVRVAAAGGAQ